MERIVLTPSWTLCRFPMQSLRKQISRLAPLLFREETLKIRNKKYTSFTLWTSWGCVWTLHGDNNSFYRHIQTHYGALLPRWSLSVSFLLCVCSCRLCSCLPSCLLCVFLLAAFVCIASPFVTSVWWVSGGVTLVKSDEAVWGPGLSWMDLGCPAWV